MKRISLFFIVILLGIPEFYSQQDASEINKPYKDRTYNIQKLFDEFTKSNLDSINFLAHIKKIEAHAIKNKDTLMTLEAQLRRAYFYQYYYASADPSYLRYMRAMVKKSQQFNNPYIEARAVKAMADHYWHKNQYEKTFEWLLLLSKRLEQIDPEEFPDMAMDLNFIGRTFYYFSNYERAIYYYKISSQLPVTAKNAIYIIHAKNTLGLCYQKLNQLEKSDNYFRAIIQDTSKFADNFWKNIASGNLGYNYYLKGDFINAIPLLKIDRENAVNTNSFGLAAGSEIPLADIYLKQKKLSPSKKLIDTARAHIKRSGQTDRLVDLFPVMSKWYAANNEPDSSAAYMDSTLAANDNYDEKYNNLKLMRANQKVQAKEKELEIEKLQTKSQIEIAQRNLTIGIVVALLAGSFLFFLYRNKYLLNKQKVKELELKNANESLANARHKLQDLTRKVRENNQLIESLQRSNTAVDPALLKDLKTGIILTKDDWVEYQILFEKAYPDYIQTLKENYTSLTDSEIRCLCLEKLHLSNQEIAALLGISSNSVMVTKHRIRKKLALKDQDALQSLIKNI